MNITRDSKLFAQIFSITNPKENLSDLIISEDCDIVAIRILTELNPEEINIPNTAKPLMFIGSGNDEYDKVLLCSLAKNINKDECIFANINDKTYKDIIPAIKNGNHYAVLKTPIDINLAKELNILSKEFGMPTEKIIMNTDIGGLGYGYEYGFSIMEKVILESKNDKYLRFPLFSDASSEALKTKEAKSEDFPASWGNLEQRARMIELSACSGAIAAGANIITVHYPDNISILKGLV